MTARHTTGRRWLVLLAAAAVWTAGGSHATAQTNPVQIENAKPAPPTGC